MHRRVAGVLLGDPQFHERTAAERVVRLAQALEEDTPVAELMASQPFTVDAQAPVADAAHEKKALLVSVFTEAVSLGLVTPPGEMGADIAVGEGQSIGNPLTFGGPYVGLFACTQKLVRQMPGRLCGETVDAAGRRAVPHHGLDLVRPDERYSAGRFARDVRRWITEIEGQKVADLLLDHFRSVQ